VSARPGPSLYTHWLTALVCGLVVATMAAGAADEPTLDAEAAGQQPSSGQCVICSEVVEPGELIKPGNACEVYHKSCYNTKRCVDRFIDKLPAEEKASFTKYKKEHPDDFKRSIVEMVVPGRRSAKDSAQIRTFVDKIVMTTSVKRIKDTVLLGERMFIQHYKSLEGMTHEEGAAKWEADRNNPSVNGEEEEGEYKVWVKVATRQRGSEGIKKQKVLENHMSLDSDKTVAAAQVWAWKIFTTIARRPPPQRQLAHWGWGQGGGGVYFSAT
jgi:hypothetical protein